MKKTCASALALLLISGPAFAGKGSGSISTYDAAQNAPVMVGKVPQMSAVQLDDVLVTSYETVYNTMIEDYTGAYGGPIVNTSHPDNKYPLMETDQMYDCARNIITWGTYTKEKMGRGLYREELDRLIVKSSEYRDFCRWKEWTEPHLSLEVVKRPDGMLGVKITELFAWGNMYFKGSKPRVGVVYLDDKVNAKLAIPMHSRGVWKVEPK